MFLEEGASAPRVRHLGAVPARVEVRHGGTEEWLRLASARDLFWVFGACRPDPDGPGGVGGSERRCRLAWERPAAVPRRFPTEAGLLCIAPAAEGRVSLRLSAS